MPREIFDQDLQRLKEKVLVLGHTVEINLAHSVNVFVQKDVDKAQQLIDSDVQVNRQRGEIVLECLTLIATQQPTASDMRSLAANIEISSELERIHDYIKGIGKMTLVRTDQPILVDIEDLLLKMATIAGEMLQNALAAFNVVDVEKARNIPLQDHDVESLFREGSHELAISVTDDLATYSKYHALQQVFNFLERSAARVTNICEWIIYKGTGEYNEIN